MAKAAYFIEPRRLLQTVEFDTKTWTTSRYTNKYDLAGNVVTTVETHSDGTTTNAKRTDYTYDKFGRLLAEKTTVNASLPVTITYTYDEIGNLASKTLGSSGVTETYAYNLQGMLTSQDSKRMKMEYTYDTEVTGYDDKPRYDGNLSMVKWQYKTTAPKDEAYVYTYDKKGQLAGGKYYSEGTATGIYDENVQYDTNGNITRMQRMGSSADWNTDYSYNYDGNQISSIDYTERSKTGTYTFTHDANGNMTNNPRRGWNYMYNYLNLLSHITDPGAGMMAYYLWLTDGTKYGVEDVSSGRTKIYKGYFTYYGMEEADAESVSFSGGEFLASGTSTAKQFTPNYVITDRLGSPRVVMDSNGSTIVRNSYYPFGLTHYNYLYTEQLLRSNRHHFNGKEKQTFSTDIDYHLLDYGARMYDPYLCRWTTQDPEYQFINPYIFSGNNPANYIDPDGKWFLRFFFPGIGNIIDGVLWSITNYSIQAASNNSWTWSGFGQSAFMGFVSGQLGMLGAGLTSLLSPFGAIPGAITQGAIEGVLGGLGGGIGSAVSGGDFGQGFKQSFWNSAISGAISGGIDGYKRAAEFDLVNNWTGTGTVIDEDYQTILGIRIGTPAQSDPSKYCYAHVGEFNSGVPYEEIIARMDNSEGADITQVARELGGKGMTGSEYGDNISAFGVKLREGYRVDATLAGKQYHNVAVTGIQTGRRWKIFGGGWGKQTFISADIWDPISGSIRPYRGKFRNMNSYSLPGDPIYRYLKK